MTAIKTSPSDLTVIALTKMANVLGEPRAQELLAAGLAELKLDALHTAEDLLHFSQFLLRHDGFEGAVGALLSVQAAIRGVRGA